MQIQDIIGQLGTYVSSQKGSNQIKKEESVSTVRNSDVLSKGEIFEGNISSVKGDKVILSLPNGQSMTARLQGNFNLVEGESVFFQVKSNDGKTIEITPLQNGILNNPILLNALAESSLPQTARNIELVNNLMQHSQPINSENLGRMGRLIAQNPDVPVDTLVKMDRFGLEATPENIDNFIRFEENSNAILEEVDRFVMELPDNLESMNLPKEDMLTLQQAIIDAADYNLDEFTNERLGVTTESSVPTEETVEVPVEGKTVAVPAEEEALTLTNRLDTEALKATNQTQPEEAQIIKNQPVESHISEEQAVEITQHEETEGLVAQKTYTKDLTSELTKLEGFKEANPTLFDDKGNISSSVSEKEILTKINDFLKANPEIGREAIKDIFSGKGYREAFKTMLEQEWMLKPEEVGKKDAVKELYERLESQLSNIDKVAKALSSENNPISNTIKNVQSNVDFMNQMNQLYSYIQIPLKMMNQSATGDLYVYQNRKKGNNASDDLSAFLHLSLTNLGNTDIAVTMHQKQVGIRFYMEDEDAFKLINDNIHILDEKLTAKGYISNISVSETKAEENFVEKLLETESVGANQKIKRYSFDVRA
jgi:hypothetical protein